MRDTSLGFCLAVRFALCLSTEGEQGREFLRPAGADRHLVEFIQEIKFWKILSPCSA